LPKARHEGKVDGSSLHVDYAYDDATGTYNGITSVFTKGMRPKSMKYPNGRLVHYTYGTGGGLDDALSRVAAIYDDNGGSPGTTAYAAYKYAGDGRIVEEALAEPDLPEGPPSGKLTYIGAASGDYSGFDPASPQGLCRNLPPSASLPPWLSSRLGFLAHDSTRSAWRLLGWVQITRRSSPRGGPVFDAYFQSRIARSPGARKSFFRAFYWRGSGSCSPESGAAKARLFGEGAFSFTCSEETATT
jgi:hypothetical protein